MNKRFYDKTCNMWVEEEEIRKLLLEFETKDILDNLEEYVGAFYSIYGQTNQLEFACDGDIEEVINVLNESWGCDIVSEEKYYIDRYTFLSSRIGELEQQLATTQEEIEEVQNKISEINGGKENV